MVYSAEYGGNNRLQGPSRHESVLGSRDTAASSSLDFAIRQWMVIFTTRSLILGEIPRYSLNRRLCEIRSRSEGFGEEKNPLSLLGGTAAPSSIAIVTAGVEYVFHSTGQ